MRTTPSSRAGAGPAAAFNAPVKTHLEREADVAAQRALQPERRRPTSGIRSPSGPTQHDTPRTAGEALPLAELFGFSTALGHDFSRVRVHADSASAEVAEQGGARAMTMGEDIFFGEGEYDPHSAKGRELLAHELTHVGQQAELGQGAFSQTKPKEGNDEGGGIGREPPAEAFEDAEGKAAEDDFVLFNKNSADPDLVDAKKIDALVARNQGPVDVELHGYASLEGEKSYNRNLSAHRAATIKRLLGDLLPEGSDIRLFAHGESFAFGKDLKTNRRVGIKVSPKAAAPAAAGPALNSSPFGKLPGLGGAPLQLGLPPPPWLQPPDPSLAPLSGFRPDYFNLTLGAWSHLQAPSERDFNSVMGQAESNYLFFSSILGPRGRLPLLGDASDLANLTAAYAYSNQMSIESPTAMEQANREFEIQARIADPNFWQTPILTKTWEWDFPWDKSSDQKKKGDKK